MPSNPATSGARPVDIGANASLHQVVIPVASSVAAAYAHVMRKLVGRHESQRPRMARCRIERWREDLSFAPHGPNSRQRGARRLNPQHRSFCAAPGAAVLARRSKARAWIARPLVTLTRLSRLAVDQPQRGGSEALRICRKRFKSSATACDLFSVLRRIFLPLAVASSTLSRNRSHAVPDKSSSQNSEHPGNSLVDAKNIEPVQLSQKLS